MDDLGRVDGGQTAQGPGEDADDVVEGDGGPGSEAILQRLAVQVLHHHVGVAPLVRPEVDDVDDVPVVDGRRHPGLAEEPLPDLLPGSRQMEEFHGGEAPELHVAGAPDRSHPALTDGLFEAVLPYDGLVGARRGLHGADHNAFGRAPHRGRSGL